MGTTEKVCVRGDGRQPHVRHNQEIPDIMTMRATMLVTTLGKCY